MQLRVRWRERPDGPVGPGEARHLMLRSDATWTAEDRTAIGDFLQAQIAEARQADPTAGWQEPLDQALDYRRWHAFSRSEEHTSELQSLMRISYAVFCLTNKKIRHIKHQ